VDDELRALAADAGVAVDWVDAADQPQHVSVGSLRAVLSALGLACETDGEIAESRARLREASSELPPLITATTQVPTELRGFRLDGDAAGELLLESGSTLSISLWANGETRTVPPVSEPGYHRLRFGDREIALAVAPPRCVTVADIAPGKKLFGLGVQLYGLRRQGDIGVGDTAALADLVTSAAREGADAIALSPVHSLFAADTRHYGPYSPSSRLFLNSLYADPAIVFDQGRIARAMDRVDGEPARFEHDPLIDWPRVGMAKYALLRNLFDDFAANDLAQASNLALDFQLFVHEGAARLREHALFEALHEHWYSGQAGPWDWNEWPPEWRDQRAPAVEQFAAANADKIQFHMFLQWIAARAFTATQDGAREAGMRIGLIADLAIGMSPGGSHAWSRQDDLLPGLNIGAPPDLFNTRGQDWGLTGFSPRALVASGFEPFLATLRAALRHAGGIRIDHVMGLTRLWLIPRGAEPGQGAYLRYPLDDLVRLIALESHRHHAVVIGEDLGTVPPEFRAQLSDAGVAGMDVLWFQRDGKAFLPPPKWRRDAVAMTSTHDLPTVAGWWEGADIATRAALRLVADDNWEIRQRAQDRAELWQAFTDAGVVAPDAPLPAQPEPAVDAAIAFVAQSSSSLALVPLEDVLGETEQPNLPGTIDEHPNWRRRSRKPAAEMLDAVEVRLRLKMLRERQ
jgi:4-alpha-glucanotransferase